MVARCGAPHPYSIGTCIEPAGIGHYRGFGDPWARQQEPLVHRVIMDDDGVGNVSTDNWTDAEARQIARRRALERVLPMIGWLRTLKYGLRRRWRREDDEDLVF
jgi:hypothetical protein